MKGFAAFLLIIPIVILAIMLVISYSQLEKEHYQAQLTTLKILRQREIDESITKSLKELLTYYNENEVEKNIPCEDQIIPDDPFTVPGKVTRTAAKISGFVSTDDSFSKFFNPKDTNWAAYLTTYYKEQGVEVTFEINPFNVATFPLTPVIPVPFKQYEGSNKLLLTCNPESHIVNNGLNGKIPNEYREIGITYHVNDKINNIAWTQTIKQPLYEKTIIK